MSESAEGRVENGAEPKGMELAKMDNRSVDETLRMIARMPAPEGLEDRVKAGLHLAEKPGRVLAWPPGRRGESLGGSRVWVRTGLARGAAAAAIALVVAGGGWGIYARVGPPQSAKTGALPQAQPSGAAQTGAFGEAGAMRRPLTLTGPVVKPTPQSTSQPVAKKDGKTVIHSQVSKTRPGAPNAAVVRAPAQ
jgi:hypothetical protein